MNENYEFLQAFTVKARSKCRRLNSTVFNVAKKSSLRKCSEIFRLAYNIEHTGQKVQFLIDERVCHAFNNRHSQKVLKKQYMTVSSIKC